MQPPTRVVIAALAITIGATAAPQLAHAGKAPAILASLPEDTAILASVDMKKLAAEPMAADALAMIKEKGAAQLEAAKTMGVDLEKDVTRVTIALAGSGLSDADNARLKILVAEGKFAFDPKAVKAEEKTHEGVTYYSTPDIDIAVISKRLFVVSDGKMPDLIDITKGKAKNAAKGAGAAGLRAAIAATSVKDPGWAVGVASDADRSKMAQASDMSWFSMSGGLRTDAVDLSIRIGMAKADAAKKMADETSAQIEPMKTSMSQMGLGELGKSLRIAAKGTVVTISATLTKSEIQTISGLLKMMLSSAGGGTTPTPPPGKPAPVPAPAPAPAKKTP
jgi:hypothetical protein